MTAPRTLSSALRDDITERFGDGKAFTVFDFSDLTESFDKPIKSITHILRKMQDKKLIEVVGEYSHKHGGGASKRYVVVPGAQFTLKTCREYQLEAAALEACLAQCSRNLQAVLDNVTRRNQPKAPAPRLFSEKKYMMNKPDRNGITRPKPGVTVHRCMG